MVMSYDNSESSKSNLDEDRINLGTLQNGSIVFLINCDKHDKCSDKTVDSRYLNVAKETHSLFNDRVCSFVYPIRLTL